MKALLVENSAADVDAFSEEAGLAGIDLTLTVAAGRDSAIAALEADQFDVVVCDLKIPTTDRALDEDDLFGIEVLQHARISQHAAPILILSGFSTIENVGKFLNRPEVDLWGSGPYPMVQDTSKKDYGLSMAQLTVIRDGLEQLEAIQTEDSADLEVGDLRAIRAYARGHGASAIEIRAARSGLSGAKAVIVTLLDSDGHQVGAAFVKLDSAPAILDEHERYKMFVAGVLPPGMFAPAIAAQPAPHRRTALIHSLLWGVPTTLYDLAATDLALARRMVSDVRKAEETCWLTSKGVRVSSIRDLRLGRRVTDAYLEAGLVDLAWRQYEERDVSVTFDRQHGDLHGANMAADSRGVTFLVDFASAEVAPACLDPVTLELSFFAHPDGREVANA